MSEDHTYSTAEIRTIALAVIAGVFFGGVATGVAFPTLPLLDEKLVISAIMLSLILSANRIARLFMNTPAGTIIDRVGARKPMIFGLFTQALAPFGYVIGLHTPPTDLGTLPILGDVSLPGVVFVLSRLFWGSAARSSSSARSPRSRTSRRPTTVVAGSATCAAASRWGSRPGSSSVDS